MMAASPPPSPGLQEIDAYWLQRRIARAYQSEEMDATKSQEVAEQARVGCGGARRFKVGERVGGMKGGDDNW